MAVTEAGSMAATEEASVLQSVTQIAKSEGRLVVLLSAIQHMIPLLVLVIKM